MAEMTFKGFQTRISLYAIPTKYENMQITR